MPFALKFSDILWISWILCFMYPSFCWRNVLHLWIAHFCSHLVRMPTNKKKWFWNRTGQQTEQQISFVVFKTSFFHLKTHKSILLSKFAHYLSSVSFLRDFFDISWISTSTQRWQWANRFDITGNQSSASHFFHKKSLRI